MSLNKQLHSYLSSVLLSIVLVFFLRTGIPVHREIILETRLATLLTSDRISAIDPTIWLVRTRTRILTQYLNKINSKKTNVHITSVHTTKRSSTPLRYSCTRGSLSCQYYAKNKYCNGILGFFLTDMR